MPGSRTTAKGATTRRAALGATSGPRGVSSANTIAVDCRQHAAQSESEANAADVHGERQEQRREQAAERDRHLAHAEREAAPLGREAVEHRDRRSDGHERAGDAAREERDRRGRPGFVSSAPSDEQAAARRARIEQRLARARAIDDHAGDHQRDGVAERRRVDERAEARGAEVVARLEIGRDHAEAPLHDRDRRLAGERQDEQPGGAPRAGSRVVTPRAPQRRAGPRRTAATRAADPRPRRRELAQHGRRARKVRTGGARQIAADRIGQCAPPLAAAELVGERRHGSRVGGLERLGRIAGGGGQQQRAPHRAAQLVLVDADRGRAAARAAAGRPARPTRPPDTRRGRGRCRAVRSRRSILTPSVASCRALDAPRRP